MFTQGEIVPISLCQFDEPLEGRKHQTSHDGVFTVNARNINSEILANVGGIRFIIGGSYILDFEHV